MAGPNAMNMPLLAAQRRAGLRALAGWALSALVAPARAQAYPSRTIRLVAPVGAGSGLDARAREVAQKLSELLGQQVVVENRPGAGGIIAIQQVAKAPADGYTLAVSGIAPVAYYPVLYRKLPYTPDELAPVSLLATGPSSLYVSGAFPAHTVAELVAEAKAKPGSLTFASQGNGTFQHLAGEWFKGATSTDLLHVPYKDYAQILTDLSSGRISMLFDSTGAVLPHVQSGRLRALAVTGASRLGSLPDVPTFTEAGLAGYDPHVNYGIFAPAATPKEVINAVSEACAKAQASREIQDILTRFGFTPVGSSPDEFASYIAKERERWSAVVKATGLQLDY